MRIKIALNKQELHKGIERIVDDILRDELFFKKEKYIGISDFDENNREHRNFLNVFKQSLKEKGFEGKIIIDGNRREYNVVSVADYVNLIKRIYDPGRVFFKRDVISIDDFTREEIDCLLKATDEIKTNYHLYKDSLEGKIMIPAFFENSTRTCLSFKLAMTKLSGKTIDFDVEKSSIRKGESLRDILIAIASYEPDVIVIRHNRDGAARFAVRVIEELKKEGQIAQKIPVINAGDGENQHPTQTFLDLYTIKEIRVKIDGTKIAFAGDLRYSRTVHSLVKALAKYEDCVIKLISPVSLQMPLNLVKEAEERGVKVESYGLSKLKSLEDVEILYMTRIQRERGFLAGKEGEEEYERISNDYRLGLENLKRNKRGIKVMHPLPKVKEIESCIDTSEYQYYYKQLKNGLYVRGALLNLILAENEK